MASEDRFHSKNLVVGEVARKGITVTKSSGTLNITSATCITYDTKDNSIVTAEADATIDSANVYASISAGSSIGSRRTIFKYVDGSYTRKALLDYEVVQG
jgi:hypothetical protein